MKRKYLLAVWLLCFLITSCTSDYSEDLSGGYFYVAEGGKQKIIWSSSPDKQDLYATIIDYDYNDDFIIAIQEPDSLEIVHQISFDLEEDTKLFPINSVDNTERSLIVADSIIRNDPFYQLMLSRQYNYWIVQHKKNKVYGPLSREDFDSIKYKLKIPRNLRISIN